MKRTAALLLALVLILSTFAGCMKKEPSANREDTSEFEALYAPVLKKYKQALDENWPKEKFMENSLSPHLANLDKQAAPSFAFLDLNGDKTPELFIGRADQRAAVYDLYTVDRGVIRQLTNTADGPLTLTDEARLVKDVDAYESLEITTYYELTDGELTAADSYIFDADRIIDGENAWYHRTGDLPADEGSFYADEMDVISEADYNRAAKDYKKGELAMKAFDDLDADALPESDMEIEVTAAEPAEEERFASILGVYKTAVAEKWDRERFEENQITDFFGDAWYETEADWADWYKDNTLGYAYRDLDSDGEPELLIGLLENPSVVGSLYAVRDGEVVAVTNFLEYGQFYIYPSGEILCQPFDAMFSTYRLNDGAAQFVAGYCPYDDTFYKTTDAASYNNIDYDNYYNTWQRVSESEMEQLNTDNAIEIDYTPFDAAVDGRSIAVRSSYRDVLDDCLWDADYYTIYDIDKDGTSELMVLMGHYEAEYYYEVYSYSDAEKAHPVGRFEGGHVGLYGIPQENGMYAQEAFQGLETIFLITLQNGEVKQETVSSQDVGDGDYTELDNPIEISSLQDDVTYSLLKKIE